MIQTHLFPCLEEGIITFVYIINCQRRARPPEPAQYLCCSGPVLIRYRQTNTLKSESTFGDLAELLRNHRGSVQIPSRTRSQFTDEQKRRSNHRRMFDKLIVTSFQDTSHDQFFSLCLDQIAGLIQSAVVFNNLTRSSPHAVRQPTCF